MCTDGLGVGVYCSGGSRFFRALLVVLNFLPTVLRRSAAPGCSPSPWVPNKSPFESACAVRRVAREDFGSEDQHMPHQTTDLRRQSSLVAPAHAIALCRAVRRALCRVAREKGFDQDR